MNTFKEMQDEVIRFRFKESLRNSVKGWINNKYAQAWGTDLWPWRMLRIVSPDIVIPGQQQGVWPVDIGRALLLQNPTGETITYMPPTKFFRAYPPGDEGTGTTLFNYTALSSGFTSSVEHTKSAPWFGPTPTNQTNLSLLYERAFGSYNASSQFQIGGMVADDDYPIWPSDWVYVLVMGAMGIGLRMENDDTWQPLEQEFQNGLQQMRTQFLDADRGVTEQFGDLLEDPYR